MLPQKHINMQIRLFIDALYIMRKPINGHFTHILQKEKWYIKSLCYNIVENFIQSLVRKNPEN